MEKCQHNVTNMNTKNMEGGLTFLLFCSDQGYIYIRLVKKTHHNGKIIQDDAYLLKLLLEPVVEFRNQLILWVPRKSKFKLKDFCVTF